MTVLTLHIRHEALRHYLARVFDGRQSVGIPTEHTEIEEAIAFYGKYGAQRFPAVTAFAIWYEGWTAGNVSLVQMCIDGPDLANRLHVLSAVVR